MGANRGGGVNGGMYLSYPLVMWGCSEYEQATKVQT